MRQKRPARSPSTLVRMGGKAGELVDQLRWLSGMGVETVIGMVPDVDRIKPLETIGREVVPEIADL